MPIDTLIAYVGTYADEESAIADYDAVKALHVELGLIDAYDAAVIAKHEDGKVKIVKKHETPTRVGGVLGAGVGLATGLVVALFPAAALGAAAVIGTGTGGVLGAVAGHAAAGMSRGDLKDLGEQLDDGEAGLIVVGVSDTEAKIDAALKHAEKVTKKEVEADQKALEKAAKDVEKDA